MTKALKSRNTTALEITLHNYRPWNHKIWLQSLPTIHENIPWLQQLTLQMASVFDTTHDYWLCPLTQQMNWPLGSNHDNSHLPNTWLQPFTKHMTTRIDRKHDSALNTTHDFTPWHNKLQQFWTHTWQHNLTQNKVTVLDIKQDYSPWNNSTLLQSLIKPITTALDTIHEKYLLTQYMTKAFEIKPKLYVSSHEIKLPLTMKLQQMTTAIHTIHDYSEWYNKLIQLFSK